MKKADGAVLWVDCMSWRRGRREKRGRRKKRRSGWSECNVRKPHDAEPSPVVDSKERTN
jgi:hypothetical protein